MFCNKQARVFLIIDTDDTAMFSRPKQAKERRIGCPVVRGMQMAQLMSGLSPPRPKFRQVGGGIKVSGHLVLLACERETNRWRPLIAVDVRNVLPACACSFPFNCTLQ